MTRWGKRVFRTAPTIRPQHRQPDHARLTGEEDTRSQLVHLTPRRSLLSGRKPTEAPAAARISAPIPP